MAFRKSGFITWLSVAFLSGFLSTPVAAQLVPSNANHADLPFMIALDDEELSGIDGEGLAFVFEDYKFSMDPRGFFEAIGSDFNGPRPADISFRRGDLRWYGFSMSGTGAGTHWDESGCTSQGYAGLGCPRGGAIPLFSAHDNPYMLRAFNYSGIEVNGNPVERTVYDFLAPSPTATNSGQDYYRFAFLGEVEVDRNNQLGSDHGGSAAGKHFKSQTLIQGNAAGSMFRLFRVADPLASHPSGNFSTDTSNQTIGLMYWSHLRGNFRFSVAQASGGANSLSQGDPVEFAAEEGLHFINVEAFFPLGQLFYQALTLDTARDALGNLVRDGNFELNVNAIPNVAAVYNDFYSLAPGDVQGYNSARGARSDINLPGAYVHYVASGHHQSPVIYFHEKGTPQYDRYMETHGYSRWGDWFPCTGVGCDTSNMGSKNGPHSTDSGIFFVGTTAYTARSFRWSRLNAATFATAGGHSGVNAGMTRGAEGVTTYQTSIAAGQAVNIGDSRVEGMSINKLRISSLGANL